jgi:hypothetical protein
MKWKSFKRRNYFKGFLKPKYRFSNKHFNKKYFTFKLELEDNLRLSWLNSKEKFYTNKSLKSFNMIRKQRKWPMSSIQNWRKQNELIRYSDE